MKTFTNPVKILMLALFLLLTKQNFSQSCAASFNYSVGSGYNVTFTSTSILSNSVTTTYFWTFGNGMATYSATGSAGMFPNYTYTSTGNYTVTLFIISSAPSCSSTTSTVITVSNSSGCGLNANFTTSQGSNGLVNFNNTSTGTVSGTTYMWNFGDGATSFATSPAHTYSANGTYVAKLLANNNFTTTCIDSTTTTINVNTYCTLVAGFTPSYMANGTVAFLNTTTPSTSVSYVWNFVNNSPSSSTLTNPTITYSANGTYTVNLFAYTSSTMCTSTATAVITITNATGCSLNSNFSTVQGYNGLMNFNNTSSGTSSTTTYAWNFGNGQSSTLTNPVITYTANGSYLVTLFSTNNTTPACVSTMTAMVNVTSVCPLVANFSYSVGSAGLVSFVNTSTGTSSLTAYSWFFSSGNPVTSASANPTHIFPNGTHTVYLTISNSSLCSTSITQTISVTSNTCALTSAFTHTVGSSGLVNFASTSTGTTANTTYTWNFGDGWTSNTANPNHTYVNGGTHYVTLVVQDSSSMFCTSTSTQALNITGISCTANPNFTLVPTSTPQFWNAIPAYPYNVTAAQWSWGDGNTSNSMYASHQYTASANYTICLTVTVSCGASASTCSSYFVYKGQGASGMINIDVLEPRTELETGLSELDNAQVRFTLYPNPNQGNFKLSLNENLPADSKITVCNILGEIVYLETLESGSDSIMEIKIPTITPGIYFVKLESLNKTSTQKVIITK